MSDTPETDKLFDPLWAKDDPPTDEKLHEVTKLFRKMERQRDEARKLAEEMRLTAEDCAAMLILNLPFPWENADSPEKAVASDALFGLYVVGEGQPNPEYWSPWSEWSLVIARTTEEAQDLAECLGAPCCRIPMDKALNLVTMPEPRMGSDL